MTLAELQALVMAQAVAKLDRLRAELAAKEAAPPPEHDPARPWRVTPLDYLQSEIADQGILIAKLTYNHEREQAEADRIEAHNSLCRTETLSRLDELAHLITHRNAVLEVFRDSVEAQKQGNEIQKAGLAAIAEAIQGRAPL